MVQDSSECILLRISNWKESKECWAEELSIHEYRDCKMYDISEKDNKNYAMLVETPHIIVETFISIQWTSNYQVMKAAKCFWNKLIYMLV